MNFPLSTWPNWNILGPIKTRIYQQVKKVHNFDRKIQFWFCGVDPHPFDVFHFFFNILCFDGHPLTSYLSCTTTYPESFFQLISFILLKPLNVYMCICVYGTIQYKTDILSEFFLKTAWNMCSSYLNQYTKSSEVWDLCNSYLCMS